MTNLKSIALLVLNYNGVQTQWQNRPLLDFCLPSCIDAAGDYAGKAQVYLVDNESADSSLSYVQETYPEVKIISKKNRYLYSYNEVISELDHELVMLLNSDIRIERNSLECLQKNFDDEKMFSVAPDIFSWDEDGPSAEPSSRCLQLRYYQGRLFWVDVGVAIEKELPEPSYVLGAAGLFDRKKLVQIGGLDEIYFPYYWEDAELGFQASIRGWRKRTEEQVLAYHLGAHSLTRDDSVEEIHLRNEYIFMWKNMCDLKKLIESTITLCIHAFRYRFGGPRRYVRAVVAALWKLMQYAKSSRYKQNKSSAPFLPKRFDDDVEAYISSCLFIGSDQPVKALKKVRAFYDSSFPVTKQMDSALQRILCQAFASLEYKKKYAQINSWYSIMKVKCEEKTHYLVAGCYRAKSQFSEAMDIYEMLCNESAVGKKIKGLSYYHRAVLADRHNDADMAKTFCAECLDRIPEHKRCQQLRASLYV